MDARGKLVEHETELSGIHYAIKSGFSLPATSSDGSNSNITSTKAVSGNSIESGIFLTDASSKKSIRSTSLPANVSSFSLFLDDWLSDGKLQANYRHSGTLFRVDRFTKEMSSRFIRLSGDALHTFSNVDGLVQKERIHVSTITSIQHLPAQKCRGDCLLHCFEINLVSTNGATAYTFGCTDQAPIMTWLQELVQVLAPAFTDTTFVEPFSRAGGCCVKKSLDSEWLPASAMLTISRKLMWTQRSDDPQTIDLRKVGSIREIENDVISIKTADDILRFKFPTAQEARKWRNLLKLFAVENGDRIEEQQLTRNDVPVLVERCIDFIFAYGLRTEGIYRKSGSTAHVQKLLKQFKLDAHTVRLCPTEYNVHTVADCLKKFMRDLPQPLIGAFSMSFIAVSSMKPGISKTEAYEELLLRLPKVEYQTLRQIVGHLNLIQTQEQHNRMTSQNLAIVWGGNLLRDPQAEDEIKYSEEEVNVVRDLIDHYKTLFHPTVEELKKEKKLLSMLEQFYAFQDELSDDHSGTVIDNLKVWIKYADSPDMADEDKTMFHITLTPSKTVYDICKEIAAAVKFRPDQLTLSEHILDNCLERPMHHEEIVLSTVLRWSNWDEEDRCKNHLEMRLAGLLTELTGQPQAMPQNTQLNFADKHTKTPSWITAIPWYNYSLRILKPTKHVCEIHKELVLHDYYVYLGCENSRSLPARSWGITFIEKDFQERSKESPYIGHILFGTEMADQLAWYSTILHNMHGDNIFPVVEKA